MWIRAILKVNEVIAARGCSLRERRIIRNNIKSESTLTRAIARFRKEQVEYLMIEIACVKIEQFLFIQDWL